MASSNARLFPGKLTGENVGAIDWSRGLVAYGCQCFVVVVSPHSLEIVQTLDAHPSPVTAVQWTRQVHTATVAQNELTLASADSNGGIVIWNVSDGSVLSSLRDVVSMPADRIEWHTEREYILMSLHHHPTQQTGLIALWNTKDSRLIWSYPITDFGAGAGASLCFSPFEPSVVCFASTAGAVGFVYDFSVDSAPRKGEVKYHIGAAQPAQSSSSSFKGPKKSAASAASASTFRQVVFSPHLWNIVFCLTAREIVVLDLKINRAIGSTMLDRNQEPFQSIIVCPDNPALVFCCHEDGSISSWRRIPERFEFEQTAATNVAQIRKKGQKKNLPCSIANCPANHNKVASVSSDGFLVVWDYTDKEDDVPDPVQRTDRTSPQPVRRNSRLGKLFIAGEMETLAPPRCMTVCPVSSGASTLVACGTETGLVQIVEMETLSVKRSAQVFQGPINFLTWIDSGRLIACNITTTEQTKTTPAKYSSVVSIIDVASCSARELRSGRPAPAPVTAIKVSPYRQHLAVCYANIIELWDLRTSAMFKNIRLDTLISAIDWLPAKSFVPMASSDQIDEGRPKEDASLHMQYVKEQLLIVLENEIAPTLLPGTLVNAGGGILRCCTVTGHSAALTSLGTEVDLGTSITAVACKGSFIASGDTTGTISCWSAGSSSNKSYPTHRGKIVAMEFCGGAAAHLLLVLHESGEFSVFDVVHGSRVSTSSYLAQRGITALAASWIEDNPVILSSDGCLRVLDRSLVQCTGPIKPDSLERPVLSPLALTPNSSLRLHSLILNYNTPGIPDDQRDFVAQLVRPDMLERIKGKPTLEVCLECAKYFESMQEVRFWTLVSQFINKYEARPKDTPVVDNVGRNESFELPSVAVPLSRSPLPASNGGDRSAVSPQAAFLSNLSTPGPIKELESEIALAHTRSYEGSTEIKEDLQKQLTGYDILVGKREEAVRLLMLSTGQPKLNYTSALKACVIAATISPEMFRNTAKMLAAQLIAQGELDEGVQLLCCIGKATDACKYFVSESRWTDAAWLANVSLPPEDRARILNSWATFLIAQGLSSKAIEVLLSLGDFHRVLDLLCKCKSFETAAMFTRCCKEHGLLPEMQEHKSLDPESRFERTPSVSSSLIPLPALTTKIYTEYGHILKGVFGLSDVAAWYNKV